MFHGPIFLWPIIIWQNKLWPDIFWLQPSIKLIYLWPIFGMICLWLILLGHSMALAPHQKCSLNWHRIWNRKVIIPQEIQKFRTPELMDGPPTWDSRKYGGKILNYRYPLLTLTNWKHEPLSYYRTAGGNIFRSNSSRMVPFSLPMVSHDFHEPSICEGSVFPLGEN